MTQSAPPPLLAQATAVPQVASVPTGASFDCAADGCAYSRPRQSYDPDPPPQPVIVPPSFSPVECIEMFPTRLRRATLRDRTGRTGPLVLPGPFCKSRPSALDPSALGWDVPPPAQIDATTFLMAAGPAEAVQLDGPAGLASGGWLLATDMDTLVDGTPEGSILPLDSLSVEVHPLPGPPPLLRGRLHDVTFERSGAEDADIRFTACERRLVCARHARARVAAGLVRGRAAGFGGAWERWRQGSGAGRPGRCRGDGPAPSEGLACAGAEPVLREGVVALVHLRPLSGHCPGPARGDCRVPRLHGGDHQE